jgi:hypothetical protein
LKFVIQKKIQKFGECPKVGGLPPIEAEILFVFFSKTKRLQRIAGKWLGKCPSLLVQKNR